jgi:hypothetical protein
MGAGTLRNELRGGTGDSGEKPVQTAFAGDELETPSAVLLKELVVTFGDPQDLVDRLDGVARNRFFVDEGLESFCEGSAKPLSLAEKSSRALRVALGKSKQLGASFGRNDSRQKEKMKKFFPGEVGGGAEFVDEVDREAATDEAWRRWNVVHRSTSSNRLVPAINGAVL